MLPGLTSKLSEAAVACTTVMFPKTDVMRVTDTTSTTIIATITPPYAGFSGVLFIHNSSGNNITTVTTGNILTAVTIGNNVLVMSYYSKVLNKYVIGALA